MQPTLLGVAGAGRLLRLRRTRRGQELGRRREDSITSKKLRMTNAGSSEHDFPAGAACWAGNGSWPSTGRRRTSTSGNSGTRRGRPSELMDDTALAAYRRICGWTLARAHARSGDRIAIAAYLGSSASFDRATAAFAESYADQNHRDYRALQEAVASGRVKAATDI